MEPEIDVSKTPASALLDAAKSGDINSVKFLISHGVDVNCQDL